MEASSSSVLTSAAGSVDVSLHPLVIMNISDHCTRARVEQKSPFRVFGALLGVQKGRQVEINNSFELAVDIVNDSAVLDKEYFSAKEEQFKQVFSSLEVLGWYTNGTLPVEDDTKFHEQICSVIESHLLVKLNTTVNTDKLPVSVYESLIDIINGEPKIMFAVASYSLATEEAERIGVDHIARMSMSGLSENSAVSQQLASTYGAIKMLHSRIILIVDYLKAVVTGELPMNHEILRKVSCLCSRLPVLDSSKFESEFYAQTNDVMLMSYLATITKGCNTASEYIQKVNTLHDHHGVSRRTRGLLF